MNEVIKQHAEYLASVLPSIREGNMTKREQLALYLDLIRQYKKIVKHIDK